MLTLAQVIPRAPAASWSRATAGARWVLACGRRVAEAPGHHVVPVLADLAATGRARLGARPALVDRQIAGLVPSAADVPAEHRADAGRVAPPRVEGDKQVAAEGDRLAMLAGEPGPARGRPALPIGRA